MNVLLEPAPAPAAQPSRLARSFGRAGGRRAAWRRRVARRVASAGALAIAVLSLTQVVLARVSPPQVTVVVTNRAVSAGSTLTPADLSVITVGASQAPATAYRRLGDAAGRRVTGPIDKGEILTPARLLRGVAAAPVGQVAFEVTAQGGAAGLVEAGSRVDAYLPGRAEPLVRDALVLAVHTAPSGLDGLAGTTEQVVVLAVPAASVGGIAAGQDASSGRTGVLLAVH